MSYSSITILGRISRKDLKHTPSGKAVLNLTVVDNQKYKDKEESVFLDFTAWEKQGEIIDKYHNVGDMIFLEGKPYQTTYEKDGQKITRLKFNVNKFSFVGSSNSDVKQVAEKHGNSAPVIDNESLPF